MPIKTMKLLTTEVQKTNKITILYYHIIHCVNKKAIHQVRKHIHLVYFLIAYILETNRGMLVYVSYACCTRLPVTYTNLPTLWYWS